jgi:hypothetical protein
LFQAHQANGRLKNSLSVVANKWDYIAHIEAAIMQLHSCSAIWHKTVPVHELLRGQTIWKGEVEVFNLKGHPKTKRCYGWPHHKGKNDESERFVTVLEMPPVESASTAVRVSIVAKGKTRNKTCKCHIKTK